MCRIFKEKYTYLLFLTFLFIPYNIYAQTNTYHIRLQLKNYSDSAFYLGTYYGNRFQVIDTADLINKNNIEFTGQNLLEGGIYFLIGENNNKYFEFIIDKEQEFSLSADSRQIPESLTANNSKENTQFFEYRKFNADLYKKMLIQKELIESVKSKKEKQSIIDNIKQIKDEEKAYQNKIIKQTPESLLALIFTALQKSPGKSAHYWDNIDFTDTRLLRTPVLDSKIAHYFDKIIAQQADSIIQEIEILFAKPIAAETFNYLIWHFMQKYEYPGIMGLDKVFVYMVENYIENSKANFLSDLVKAHFIGRAKQLKPLLLGEQAPELIMLDSKGNFQSCYDVHSEYTLIIFWDHECQICQEEIEVLKKLYESKAYGLEVFAVEAGTKTEAWKNYINENSLSWINVFGNKSISDDYHELYNITATPSIYVLDWQKKIIAKQISAKQIEGFLKNHLLLANNYLLTRFEKE